jgi:tetratricopeptide (TPR) repeat protein
MTTDATADDQADDVDEPSRSPRRHGDELDRLAALEEERRFLLRSLADLEREHDAGDVDDVDYETLKDGYTARAAAVLRRIEAGRLGLAPQPKRRWGRTLAIAAGVLAAAVAIGLALGAAWGERDAGQGVSGFTPGDDARTLLASARSAMNQGDFQLANELLRRVDEMERERGVDNAEARAYYGWTLALLALGDSDDERAASLLDASVLALDQAIEIDPDYADPHCFMAIVEFRFRSDADAALPFIVVCEESNPPADLASLIGPLADEIRAAAG